MSPDPAMASRPFDVICRTFNCEGTLAAVIAAIGRSEGAQPRYLFVDNSSTDSTREIFPESSHVINYSLPDFNYAMAINIAIPYLVADYVLVISSHIVIDNPMALRRAMDLLDANPRLGGVCFSSHNHGEIRPHFVTETSFNGWNGLWNSCSLYRSSLLKERPFNPEVYSAEDQEWSRWLLQSRGMELAHLVGTAMQNHNPNQMSLEKRVKEWECVAWFVCPKYLSFAFIKSRFYKAIYELYRTKPSSAWFWFLVGMALVKARLFGARGRSRYH